MMYSKALLAVLLVFVGLCIRSGRKVWTKHFQEKKHPAGWRERPAMLTASQMLVASIFFFLWAFATGGPKVTRDVESFVLLVLAGGALNAFKIYFRYLLQGIKGVTLSSPIEALVPLGALIVGFFLGDDLPLNWLGLTGVVAMVAGLFTLDVSKSYAKEPGIIAEYGCHRLLVPIVDLARNPATLAIWVIVALSSFAVHVDSRLSRSCNVPWALAWIFSIVALTNFAKAIYSGEHIGLSWKQVFWASIPGSMFALGNDLTCFAYILGNTTYIAALKRGDVMLSMLGGRYINKETTDFGQRLTAGTFICIGAILITLGIHYTK